MELAAALDLDECYIARCFAAGDLQEGMQALAEKRSPRFQEQVGDYPYFSQKMILLASFLGLGLGSSSG